MAQTRQPDVRPVTQGKSLETKSLEKSYARLRAAPLGISKYVPVRGRDPAHRLESGSRRLESASVGLDDLDALRVLRNAFGQEDGGPGNELVRRFYTQWFALDPSVRDLFPPEMDGQRAAFAHALHWVYGELVAQRAQEPVAFLAQLGQDHRKYGVLPGHYDTLRRALYGALRTRLGDAWTEAVDDAAGQSLNLITGVMSGAADADEGPAWWDGTVSQHMRVSRDLAVVRLRLDRPLHYHPGQYVNVQVPQCPRRWRYLSPAIPADPDGGIEFHVRLRPRRPGQHRHRQRNAARRPVATVQSARRTTGRPGGQ